MFCPSSSWIDVRLHSSIRSTIPRKSDSAPIGSWIGAGLRLQAIDDHLDGALRIRAGAVHLVDEADPRHAVLVGLPPDRLRLRLDAGDGIEHDHATVEHAQRALDLDGEVDVARRVDDVDRDGPSHEQVVAAAVMVMPRSRSCSIQSIVAAPS